MVLLFNLLDLTKIETNFWQKWKDFGQN